MKLWPTLGVAFLLIAAWGTSMRLSWSLGRENARNEAQASTLKSTVDTLNIISAGVPEPAIIAEPDFEAILADTKAMMIASYPAEQREAVSAALELESEPLNVIARATAFREMLLRQRINEGARACMLSHSAGTDLGQPRGQYEHKAPGYHSGNGYHRRSDGK